MIKRIGYGLLGIGLLIGTLATGTYGLSERNTMIYTKAIALQDEITALGFRDFRLLDYSVRFYDGQHDYKVTGEGDAMTIQKVASALPVFAGTTYAVDGAYNVILPTVEKMSSLYSMMPGGFQQDEAGANELHITVLWHEAFHAYQMTNYKETLEKLLEHPALKDVENLESVIVKAVDQNPELLMLQEKSMEALTDAMSSQNIDQIRQAILEYKKWDDAKRSRLPDEVKAVEEYFERVEGTARYVEAHAYQVQHDQQAFEKRYIKEADGTVGGSGKYYTSGMLKCLLLDRIDPNWKVDYDFEESLTDLLYTQIGG